MEQFPIADVGRIIEKSGAEDYSDEAAESLSRILVEDGGEIADLAVKFAQEFGRDVVNEEDIKYSIKVINIFNPQKDVYIDSEYVNLTNVGTINIEKSFNQLYQDIDDFTIEKHVKSIETELKKGESNGKVNVSKIKKATDWLKRNASWTIFPLANILLNLYGLYLPK